VTSFCKFSFKSFASLFNFSRFWLNELVVSSFAFSNKLSISIISFSIFSFILITLFILSLNSLAELSISIFSFFNDSSSSIDKTL
jgi:hypothetical protein